MAGGLLLVADSLSAGPAVRGTRASAALRSQVTFANAAACELYRLGKMLSLVVFVLVVTFGVTDPEALQRTRRRNGLAFQFREGATSSRRRTWRASSFPPKGFWMKAVLAGRGSVRMVESAA
jgi:hypothetical protein